MREIKFRAWDTKAKQMFVPFELKRKLNQRLGEFGDSIILLQYTGLKDKNGVEIYEGDILQNEAGHVGAVEWYEPHALYILRLSNDTYDLWQISVRRTEVIGNIYENPELLEKND